MQSVIGFSGGSAPILLRNVECQGHEERLYDCPRSAVDTIMFNCDHSKDYGVSCGNTTGSHNIIHVTNV